MLPQLRAPAREADGKGRTLLAPGGRFALTVYDQLTEAAGPVGEAGLEGLAEQVLARGLDAEFKRFLRRDTYPCAAALIAKIDEPERRRMEAEAQDLEAALEALLKQEQRAEFERTFPGVVKLRNYPIYDHKVVAGQLLENPVAMAQIGLYFVPVAGQLLGVIEAIRGRGVFDDRALAGWERLIGMIAGAPFVIRAGRKGAAAIIELARRHGKDPREVVRQITALGRLSTHAEDLKAAKAAAAAGHAPTAPQLKALEETQAVVEEVTGTGATLNRNNATSASSVAQAFDARTELSSQLTLEEATAVFAKDGKLHPEVVARSRDIIRAGQLKNEMLKIRLTADGSNLADWAKMTTPSFRSPAGAFQVHFYQNLATGKLHYGDDFKVVFDHAGSW